MSNAGGDDGDGNNPPSPESMVDDPMAILLGPEGDLVQPADGSDSQPSQPPAVADQNPDIGGAQDTSATEQPQQGDVEAAGTVRPGLPGPSGSQSQDSTSAQTTPPAGTVPATPSKGGFLSNLTKMFGGSGSGRKRGSSSATVGSPGNVTQRRNTSIASGSRPVSLAEQPETPPPEPEVPDLVGPSRRRLNSQGSGSQGRPVTPPGQGNAGTRATRADTGLSVDSDVADLEARGENDPTPRAVRNRPDPLGSRSAGGNQENSPNTLGGSDWELRRRNNIFIRMFDQIQNREATNNWTRWQEERDRAIEWEFQLGGNTLDQMAAEEVTGIENVLTAAGARVPADIRTQIIEEAQRRSQETRDRVNAGLENERLYVENTVRNIMDLIDDMEGRTPTQRRRRGTSRVSGTSSLDAEASQPELNPLDPEALRRAPKDDLVNRVLALEQQRQEAVDAATEAEDRAREMEDAHQAETKQLQASANANLSKASKTINDLEKDIKGYREILGAEDPAGPSRKGPAGQPSSPDGSEGSSPGIPSRLPAAPAPRSPARERAFEDLRTLLGDLARHEDLVRRLHARARLNPEVLDANTAPFSESAQLSRTQALLQLQAVTEHRDQLQEESNALSDQVARLEATRVSPQSRQSPRLFSNLFGGGGGREPSSDGSRSRTGSRADLATSVQTLADELQERGSGKSSGSGSRQAPESRRQSEAGSRTSGPSGNRSDGSNSNPAAFATPQEIGSRQSVPSTRQSGGSSRRSNASGGEQEAVYPAPLRVIPEWLVTHPNGPCEDCVPTFRFPPELGELPTCGCICDLAFGDPPTSGGGSSGAGSSRSRTGSGRSVRFADDGEAADEGDGRRRPAPLNLAALQQEVNEEANNAGRPNTPYPADAEGGPSNAPAGAPADVPATEEQAETVPIQPPEEETPAVVEPAVEAPAVAAPAAPGGRRAGRCPCCGRGTYGVPPAGGVPQVAFYNCRNMAGQPVPPEAAAPVSLAEGLRNALAAAAAAAGLIGPGGGGNADPPAVPEPPANVPVEERRRRNTDPPAGTAPIAPGTPQPVRRENSAPPALTLPGPQAAPHEAAPRGRVMTFLALTWALIWDLFNHRPLIWLRNFASWLLSLLTFPLQWSGYFIVRHLLRQNVRRPEVDRRAISSLTWLATILCALWVIGAGIALGEERRIWRVANAQLSAAYFRGSAYRRPYPFWPVFEPDSGLLVPAFGNVSQWLRSKYIVE